MYRVSQKSSPLRLSTIFSLGLSLFAQNFCPFIGNLYLRRYTDFRLFSLTFNEMELFLPRAPIIFTVSSLDSSAGNNNAEYHHNGNDVIGHWSQLDCRLS